MTPRKTLATYPQAGRERAGIAHLVQQGVEWQRWLWRLATPFVWALNRVGWCSYKWRNVCHGAWRRDRFDALWHHRWYGTPIKCLPETVILAGIAYDTSVGEGLVVFREQATLQRIMLERDPHDPLAFLWYVTLTNATSASHVMEAYAWIRAVFGGSFEKRLSEDVAR